MPEKKKHGGFTPQETLISILPYIVASLILFPAIVITNLVYFQAQTGFEKLILFLYGALGCLYLLSYHYLYTAAVNKSRFAWFSTIIASVTLCILVTISPYEIDILPYILVLITALSTSLIASRGPVNFLILSTTVFYLATQLKERAPSYDWIIHFGILIGTLMGVETIQQLKNITTRQINRLEIINEFSKQIVSTLDTKHIFSLLNTTMQNVMKVDSYYIGIVDGDDLYLEVFYDDGEYFQGLRLPRKGTLSNWVIQHQKELFLPDLRKELQLEDVGMVVLGKEKASLSWMGAPLRGQYVNGIMVISSYSANDFDRSDMELLSNIAQRAALALDNTYQHALVEIEARLDSLTRVYNHGYFVQSLHKQAQACLAENQPLSLIMLDIDFFKKYNDTFGHVVGDEVLVQLCNVIRNNIKITDAVGRWGGEEFAISLPNTSGEQAAQVAERIRETMASLSIKWEDQTSIPCPTVSQGIAVFPAETAHVSKLIDLSDSRLYIAKKRGRDQIEPTPAFLKNIPKN